MKKYPGEVLTKNIKGNKEVRVLVDKGKFCRYQYMDPKTNKIVEKNKTSLILKTDDKEEHLYFIPLKDNKFLVIKPKQDKKKRKVWDKNKAVDLF